MHNYQQIKNYLADLDQINPESEQINRNTQFHKHKQVPEQDLTEWIPQTKIETQQKSENPTVSSFSKFSLPRIRNLPTKQHSSPLFQILKERHKDADRYEQLVKRLSSQTILKTTSNRYKRELEEMLITQTKVSTVVLRLPHSKHKSKPIENKHANHHLLNNSLELVKRIYRNRKKIGRIEKQDLDEDRHLSMRVTNMASQFSQSLTKSITKLQQVRNEKSKPNFVKNILMKYSQRSAHSKSPVLKCEFILDTRARH